MHNTHAQHTLAQTHTLYSSNCFLRKWPSRPMIESPSVLWMATQISFAASRTSPLEWAQALVSTRNRIKLSAVRPDARPRPSRSMMLCSSCSRVSSGRHAAAWRFFSLRSTSDVTNGAPTSFSCARFTSAWKVASRQRALLSPSLSTRATPSGSRSGRNSLERMDEHRATTGLMRRMDVKNTWAILSLLPPDTRREKRDSHHHHTQVSTTANVD